MKSVIASLIAVAGLSVAANAGSTMTMVYSTDGINFSSHLDVLPGTHVEAMVRASTDTAGALGLGQVIFQPVISNFIAANTVDAFANGGQGSNTSTPSGVVADAPGQYGRLSPFGRTALGATNFIFAHRTSVGQPAGEWLRIAQKQVTAWAGGSGNTTGNSGVPCAQLANVGRTASDPAFNGVVNNVDLFRFGFTVNNPVGDTLSGDILNLGINTNSNTRAIAWFNDMNTNVGGLIEVPAINGGSITVVPTPASLALLGLGGLAMGRRRR